MCLNPLFMKKATVFLALLFSINSIIGQSGQQRPNIFIDCQMNCDFIYLKQELRFINYMQNRDDADIYILATTQRVGSGGREVQLAFEGNEDFNTHKDTVRYQTDQNDTDAIIREKLLKNLKKGLLPYMLMTDISKQIEYSIPDHIENFEDNGAEINDPWNYWVFNIGGNAYLNGEASYRQSSLQGRFNASRVTEKSKFRYFYNYSFSNSTFILTDGEEFSSFIKRYSNFFMYVHSINEHWSAGLRSDFGSSTFGNTDFDGTIKPAIEYNIYPYKDASTRRFSLQYSIGPEYKDYTDITIYDKLEETVLRHNFNIEFEQTQKWGSVEVDFGAGQYFHDLKLWSLFLNPNLEWIVFKGFSLDFGGFGSFVADRINIAKSDITDEDIILQIKQLNTNFTYYSYIGINYRFGSKYNNFVNPRF